MLLPLAAALAVRAYFRGVAVRVKPLFDRLSNLGLILLVTLITVGNIGNVLAVFGTRGIPSVRATRTARPAHSGQEEEMARTGLMAAAFACSGSILDGMTSHVWQGATASRAGFCGPAP